LTVEARNKPGGARPSFHLTQLKRADGPRFKRNAGIAAAIQRHCAYSCQLHLPALAKCKTPPFDAAIEKLQQDPATSYVYVGVENLSDIASIFFRLVVRA